MSNSSSLFSIYDEKYIRSKFVEAITNRDIKELNKWFSPLIRDIGYLEGAHGITALFIAAEAGDLKLVRSLISQGVDINHADFFGNTVLFWVGQREMPDSKKITEELIAAGADVNAINGDDDNPILHATAFGNETVVRVLLKHGADFLFKNREGKSPLTIALEAKDDPIVRLLTLQTPLNTPKKSSKGRSPKRSSQKTARASQKQPEVAVGQTKKKLQSPIKSIPISPLISEQISNQSNKSNQNSQASTQIFNASPESEANTPPFVESPMSQAQRPNSQIQILNSNSDKVELYFHEDALAADRRIRHILGEYANTPAMEQFLNVLILQINATKADRTIRILDDRGIPLLVRLALITRYIGPIISLDFGNQKKDKEIIEILYKIGSYKFIRTLKNNGNTFIDAERYNIGVYSKNILELYKKLQKAKSFFDVIRMIDEMFMKMLNLTYLSVHNSVLTNSNSLRSEVMGEYLERYKVGGVVDAVQLSNFITDLNFLPSKSASKTIILKAQFDPLQYKDTDVPFQANSKIQKTYFIKTFPLIPGNSSLEPLIVEGKMYVELNKLAKNNVMPNILCAPIVTEVDNLNELYKKTPKSEHRGLYNQMTEMNKRLGRPMSEYGDIWHKGMMIVTQAGDISLHDLLKYSSPTSIQVESLMFQLMYVLYVFKNFKISHGDCHFGNILIARLPQTQKFIYRIMGTYYELETDVQLKIYDYDHAMIAQRTQLYGKQTNYIEPVPNPGRLCDEYAECPDWNEKLDLVIAVLNLVGYSYKECTKVADFLAPGSTIVTPSSRIHEKISKTLSSLSPEEEEEVKALGFASGSDLASRLNVGEINSRRHVYTKKPFKDMTWIEYFREISNSYHKRIIRRRVKTINNQLYVPDSIVKPVETIWSSGLFRKFESTLTDDTVDLNKQIVFTIDE